MVAWLGPAITAGASLISSLFGGKKKEKTSNRVNYAQMVADAQAAGFNPLTALRNGGAAGYTESTTGATPFASRFADGLASAAQTFFQNYDPIADKTKEMGYRVMEAQLANLQADTDRTLRFGQVPVREAPARQQRMIGSNIPKGGKGGPLADAAGKALTPTVERPTVTNPHPTGSGMVVDPNYPDASSFEQRYGDSEIASTVVFLRNAIADVIKNARRDVGPPPSWTPNSMRKPQYRQWPKAYRGPRDPYDRKMYIPPALHGGRSYQ